MDTLIFFNPAKDRAYEYLRYGLYNKWCNCVWIREWTDGYDLPSFYLPGD